MFYNTDLQNNNTSLKKLLTKINALPEIGNRDGSKKILKDSVYVIKT